MSLIFHQYLPNKFLFTLYSLLQIIQYYCIYNILTSNMSHIKILVNWIIIQYYALSIFVWVSPKKNQTGKEIHKFIFDGFDLIWFDLGRLQFFTNKEKQRSKNWNNKKWGKRRWKLFDIKIHSVSGGSAGEPNYGSGLIQIMIYNYENPFLF